MKKLILFLIFISGYYCARSQYFQTGQDPASIRWRLIHTNHFKLICPDYFEAEAQKLAGKLEAVYPYGSFSLKHHPEIIPVVLHTQTVRSNGLVAWAPRRSEFFTTPHQSVYPQDWLEQLALHEFRHVVQVNKVNSNLPRWARFLLGEQGTALVFGAYLPWWLIEGDAVITETTLSNYGRGRLPSFLSEHRAQVVEKGIFSYDKAYLGSYKDFVPDHYKLGYYLAGNIRAIYGSSVWEEAFTRVGSKPLSILPVRQVLKERTGMNTAENYRTVFDSLKQVWTQEDILFDPLPFRIRSKPDRYHTQYIHNHWADNTTIFSYKTAFQQIPTLVAVGPQGEERRIVTPGRIFDESVGYRGEWIIWSEQISDLRWHHGGHSLIRLFHGSNGQRYEFKSEWKAFSPAICPDRMRVAVVEADYSGHYFISVYQLPDGKLLHRFQTPDNNYFISPEWIDNSQIAVVVLTREGKRVATIDLDSDQISYLTDKDLGDIKDLHPAGKWLYFIGSWSGKNSLYRIHLISKEMELVYEPRFGAESPAVSPDGARIILSDYTSDGYRLIEIPATHDKIVPFSEVKKGQYPLAEALADQEQGIVLFPDSAEVNYPSENYSKASHLFNFHSWAPVFVDPVDYQFFPGVSLMSQDLLGISETTLGYQWDLTERTGKFTADYSFKGWYPVIDLSLSAGNRASEYPQISRIVDNQGSTVGQDTTLQRYTWGQTHAGLGVRLPLTMDKGAFNRLVQPEVQYGFTDYRKRDSAPERFQEGNFHSLAYRLYLYQMLRKSYLDMYPDFGIVLDATYRHSLAGTLQAGELYALQSLVYLPGVMKNHGIKIYGGAQEKKNAGALDFTDVVRYARGWGRIKTTAIYTGGADYKLPLVYPDMNLFGLLYLRRVNASLFADYTRLKGNFYKEGKITGRFTEDISSLGAEVTADINLVRFYAPATLGFRASYLPERKNVYFDFLFSIDFTAL
jgi:hypothetical protein